MAFTQEQSKWEKVMIREKVSEAFEEIDGSIVNEIQIYSHWTDNQKLNFLAQWRDERVAKNNETIAISNATEQRLLDENAELNSL